jgi:hypothetical protein
MNIDILIFSELVLVGLWNSLIINQGIANPFKRFLRFDHVNKKGSFEQSVVVWNVLIEWNISSSHSHHHLITSALNNLLGCSNKIDLSFHVDDWNCDVHLCDQSLNFFFLSGVLTFLCDEWDWVKVEKFIAFLIKLVL